MTSKEDSRQNRITVNSSYKSRKTLTQDIGLIKKDSLSPTRAQKSSERLHSQRSPSINPPLAAKRFVNSQPEIVQEMNMKKKAFNGSENNENMHSNVDLLHERVVHADMSGSAENPFEEWDKVREGQNQSQLDLLMQQVRPSVYNLPQNPMN